MNKYGWELFAEKCYCARDDWSEDTMDSITGTWDEKTGSWYAFRHRCSACKREIRDDREFTRYCPDCGKEMLFVEKVTKQEVK